jgi:hypothetical protein
MTLFFKKWVRSDSIRLTAHVYYDEVCHSDYFDGNYL